MAMLKNKPLYNTQLELGKFICYREDSSPCFEAEVVIYKLISQLNKRIPTLKISGWPRILQCLHILHRIAVFQVFNRKHCLFVKILLGVEIICLEYIEFIHVSKYSKFHPKIKQDYQNATAWVIFSWFSEKCPSLNFKLELHLWFLLRGHFKSWKWHYWLFFLQILLIPLYITLNEKLEPKAKKEFVFPKEPVLFFFFLVDN